MNLHKFPDEDNLALDDFDFDLAHRRHGLGTLLLTFVEKEARQQGAKEITGKVVRRDVDTFPGLLAWYERNGFAILPPGPKAQPHDVARIRRTL